MHARNVSSIGLAARYAFVLGVATQVGAGCENAGVSEQASEREALGQVGTSLPAPAGVIVSPRVISAGASFEVRWAPSFGAIDYLVQVRMRQELGFGLVWQSDPIAGDLVYSGAPVTRAGAYHVVVVARAGTETAESAPVSLDILGGEPEPTDPPPVDAGPATGALPAWAEALAGSYASRSNVFASTSGGLMGVTREYALVQIVRTEAGLELRSRLCSQRTISLGATLDLVAPRGYPELRRRILIEDDGRWRTDAEPIGTGYQREGVPECAGRAGQLITKRPEQRWLRSQCRCPSMISQAPRIDDCRVTDDDRDGQPGLAYRARSPLGTLEWTTHFATTIRTYALRGRVLSNGTLTAEVRSDEASWPLICEPSAICNANVVESTRPCTSKSNSQQLVRLSESGSGEGAWTCDRLLANTSRVFSSPNPQTPSSCERDDLTGG